MTSPAYLNALRAFEASARHQSFSEAAKELNVTPAAVGQLVRHLEQVLDVTLFIREKTGKQRLITTQVADMVLPDIRAGFEQINLGLERLKQVDTNHTLNITVSPAFAEKWLLPKLDRFQQKYPDIDVYLNTDRELTGFLNKKIDIGIRYGYGVWEGLHAIPFLEEEIFPVCSPEFKLKHTIHQPSDLLNKTLIHDLSVNNQEDFLNWKKWLNQVKVKNINIMRGMRINNSATVIQAAIDGFGIALARSVMVNDDLKSGRLVRLFPDIEFKSNMSYYIVYREENLELSHKKAFKNWLLNEAKCDNDHI